MQVLPPDDRGDVVGRQGGDQVGDPAVTGQDGGRVQRQPRHQDERPLVRARVRQREDGVVGEHRAAVVAVTQDDGRPVVSDDPHLTLPHPRAHERAFVLVPWLVLEPGAEIPGRGRVADLVAALPPEDVAAVVRWEHLS